jgi:hypothetical protein
MFQSLPSINIDGDVHVKRNWRYACVALQVPLATS